MFHAQDKRGYGMERQDEIVHSVRTEDAFEVELRLFTTLRVDDIQVLPVLRWFAVSKPFFRTFAS